MAEQMLARKMVAMTGHGVLYTVLCPRCEKKLDGSWTPKDLAERSGSVTTCAQCGQELVIP